MSTVACGVDDKGLRHGKGGAGGSEGSGNGKGGAGDSDGSGKGGAGGSDGGGSGNVGNAGGAGDVPIGGDGPMPCKDGKMQCNGNTPQTCTDGVWVDGKQCGGSTKVCTVAGVCAAYRLVNAGIDSFGVRAAEPGPYILKEQTLTAAPRACVKDVGCVTGGIR